MVGGRRAVSYTHLTPADERSSVDLGGRRIIKKKKNKTPSGVIATKQREASRREAQDVRGRTEERGRCEVE